MEDISPKRAQTRQRLLDAAFHVLAREGLTGASIEMIVAQAGFTRGAFYSNFETKEELFRAVVASEMRKRLVAVGEAVGHLQQTEVPDPITAEFIGEVLQAAIVDPKTEREWQIILTEIELHSLRNPGVGGLVGPDLAYINEVADTLLPAIQALGVDLRGDPQVVLRLLINGYLGASRQALRTESTIEDNTVPPELEWFTLLVERFLRPANEG